MKPRQPEHANKITDVANAPGFQIERWLEQYAYPQNGNTHNPTPRYFWFLLLDGRRVDSATKQLLNNQTPEKSTLVKQLTQLSHIKMKI